MSDQHKRGFTGLWIPRHIVEDVRLTALEKMLFAEIDALDNEDGCYASNRYLSCVLGCSEDTVSRYVSHLIELQYIIASAFDGRQRRLNIVGRVGKNTEAASAPMPTIYNKDNIKDNNISASASPSAEKKLELPIDADKTDPAVEKALKREFDKSVKRAKTRMSKSYPAEFMAVYDIWPKKCDKVAAYGAWTVAIELGVPNETIISAAKAEAENGRFCQNLLTWLQNEGWKTPPTKAFGVGRLPSYGQSCQKPENGLVMTKKRPSHEQVIEQFLAFSKARGAKEVLNAFYSDASKWREYAKNSQCTPIQLYEKIRTMLPVENCGNIFKETLDNG